MKTFAFLTVGATLSAATMLALLVVTAPSNAKVPAEITLRIQPAHTI